MTELSLPGLPAGGWIRDYWRETRGYLLRDWPIYAVIAAHALAAAGLALYLGEPRKLAYLPYLRIWTHAVVAVGLIYIAVFEVPASIKADPRRPLARLKSRLPELLGPRVAAAAVLILGMVLLMGSFTSVKNMLSDLQPFVWDVPLANLDAWLHAGRDPWVLLQPILDHHGTTRAIQYAYAPGWMILLCATPAVVAVSRRLAPVRMRFFLTYMFAWIVLGNLMAGLFMSAGPVYYGEVTGDAARFADQMRYLSFSEGMVHSSYDIQTSLWMLHEQQRAELGSGISAFPSLHVAMATLFMLTGFAVNRWVGWAGAAFLLIILTGSVHLGWHYAVDGYVSLALAVGVWFGLGAWQRARHCPPPTEG